MTNRASNLKIHEKRTVLPLAPRQRGEGGELASRERGVASNPLFDSGSVSRPLSPAPLPAHAGRGVVVFTLLVSLASSLSAQAPVVIDSFEAANDWIAAPSDGVSLRIISDAGRSGQAMRLDYDFQGGGGYAIARKPIALDLPENYEFTFWIRAGSPVNTLEFKVLDPTGDNVWWVNQRDYAFPSEWTRMRIKRRNLSFAWGPARDEEIRRTSGLEIVITAATGGKGTVWIDDFTFTPLEPERPYDLVPQLSASSAGPAAKLALDGNPDTKWSAVSDRQSVEIDFLRRREFGGIVIDWDPEDFARTYEVQFSEDGKRWETVRRLENGDGGRDYLFMPESDSRYVRLNLLESSRRRGYAIRDIRIEPLEFAKSRTEFFRRIAAETPRGTYPKYFQNVQSYWTIVGVAADDREALINEEGAIEIGAGGFSLEPMLSLSPSPGGRGVRGEGAPTLVTWADATSITQSLENGELPIPTVEWKVATHNPQPTTHNRARPEGLKLAITTWAAGQPRHSVIWARYRLTNETATPQKGSLHIAIRPFQVNPPWQFLAVIGGASQISSIAHDGELIDVDERTIVPLTHLSSFGAATFDQGDVVSALREGSLPTSQSVDDHFSAASGLMTWAFDVAQGASQEFVLAVPLWERPAALRGNLTPSAASTRAEDELTAARVGWESQLARVEIQLPESASYLARSIRSNLAYILINIDGPRIQPGSRSYDRSWIRDGALTSAALLRLGHPEEVVRFLEWFAGFQYPSGKIPCCVDARGGDPVDEHDSHGQFIYLTLETYKFTRDRTMLLKMWPHVVKTVEHIDSLRQLRRTPEYQTEEKRAFYGLVPESISHEGYSAKPMHSYWDTFFILKGLKDAVTMAEILERQEERKRFAAIRDEFQKDLYASIDRAMAMHGIDYIPGSVELGDFDATSTTIAVSPVDELPNLPQPALQRTFDKYFENFIARRDGKLEWEGYTPYEWRVAGTYIRLGQKERAHALIDFFFSDSRPRGWNHWAEVVFNDPATPRFIGDMPHTWVGSDFIRSILDIFAYEREDDQSLVLGAGIPVAWLRGSTGVRIAQLRTPFGPLTYSMLEEGGAIRMRIEDGLRVPPGGIVVISPVDGSETIVRALPADIRLNALAKRAGE